MGLSTRTLLISSISAVVPLISQSVKAVKVSVTEARWEIQDHTKNIHWGEVFPRTMMHQPRDRGQRLRRYFTTCCSPIFLSVRRDVNVLSLLRPHYTLELIVTHDCICIKARLSFRMATTSTGGSCGMWCCIWGLDWRISTGGLQSPKILEGFRSRIPHVAEDIPELRLERKTWQKELCCTLRGTFVMLESHNQIWMNWACLLEPTASR